MTDTIRIECDPKTRELVVLGPEGFVYRLDEYIINPSGLPSVQRLLNAVWAAAYERGCECGANSGENLV